MAGAVLLLAGCTIAPRPPAPLPVELPPSFVNAEESHSTADQLPQLLRQEPLRSLIDEALDGNFDLRAASARVERAEAQARIAGADHAPQLSLSADASRRKQNFIGLPIPGAEDRLLSNTSTTLGVSLNVSWEADLWGRLRNLREAARRDRDAVIADSEAARLSVAAQTAKAWFAVTESAGQVGLAEARLANRRSTLERMRRRYEAGIVSPADVRLAEVGVATAEAALAARRRLLDITQRQLELLLARYPSGSIPPGDALPAADRLPPAGVPAEVIARRPDLRAAEQRLRAAGHRVASARAALYPQLRLSGSAGTATSELENLLDGDFSVWSLAGGLVQPLLQGGRLRAGIDLAEAGEDEQLALFAQSVLVALSEVEGALSAEETLAEQERALGAAVGHALAARRSAEDRYFAGLVDYLVVLETERQAYDAESQLLEARRLRLANRVDLHLAIGGAFDESDVRMEEALGAEGQHD